LAKSIGGTACPRQVGAGERGVVGADPAAEQDLQREHRQRERRRPAERTHARLGLMRALREREPCEQRENRHAAGQVRGDDRGLEQHGHGPLAERGLKHDQRRDRAGEPG
jgi:hypothetical protein